MSHQQCYCSNFSNEGFDHPSEGLRDSAQAQAFISVTHSQCIQATTETYSRKQEEVRSDKISKLSDLRNNWHCKSETCCQQDIWSPEGSAWETASYQEGGEYKSMCSSRTQQERSHYLCCRTTQCVPASCTSLQPSLNRMGQIEKITCLLHP